MVRGPYPPGSFHRLILATSRHWPGVPWEVWTGEDGPTVMATCLDLLAEAAATTDREE